MAAHTDLARLTRRLSSMATATRSLNVTPNHLSAWSTLPPAQAAAVTYSPYLQPRISIPLLEIPSAPMNRPSIENPTITVAIETPTDGYNSKEIVDNKQHIFDFELPAIANQTTDENGYQAAVMIGIRRRKMKKHKLRKLRKRTYFETAKVSGVVS